MFAAISRSCSPACIPKKTLLGRTPARICASQHPQPWGYSKTPQAGLSLSQEGPTLRVTAAHKDSNPSNLVPLLFCPCERPRWLLQVTPEPPPPGLWTSPKAELPRELQSRDLLPAELRPWQLGDSRGHSGAAGRRGCHLAAEHGAHEAQHGRPQDGEHPGIHDGVDGQEAQGQQVPLVVALFALLPAELVHVGSDLQDQGWGGVGRSSEIILFHPHCHNSALSWRDDP